MVTAYSTTLMTCSQARYLRRSSRETFSPMDAINPQTLAYTSRIRISRPPQHHSLPTRLERDTSDLPRWMLLSRRFPGFAACRTIVIRPPHSTRRTLECSSSFTASILTPEPKPDTRRSDAVFALQRPASSQSHPLERRCIQGMSARHSM